MPEFILFDIDTTLLDAFGAQEGAAFNYHYQDKGYHPLFAFDGLTESEACKNFRAAVRN